MKTETFFDAVIAFFKKALGSLALTKSVMAIADQGIVDTIEALPALPDPGAPPEPPIPT